MNILVCIKQVPDTETRIKLSPEKQADLTGAKWIMNPYDEYAVEAAIQLKEKNPGAQTTVLTVGPKSRVQDCLRTALAMGIDSAALVDTESASRSDVGQILVNAIQQLGQNFDLILTGKMAIDTQQSLTPAVIAHQFQYPFISQITRLEKTENGFIFQQEGESGSTVEIEVNGPCVASTTKGLNQPRYASLPGIMKAKKKEILELTLSSTGSPRASQVELPALNSATEIIKGDDVSSMAKELTRKLKDDSKVIGGGN